MNNVHNHVSFRPARLVVAHAKGFWEFLATTIFTKQCYRLRSRGAAHAIVLLQRATGGGPRMWSCLVGLGAECDADGPCLSVFRDMPDRW